MKKWHFFSFFVVLSIIGSLFLFSGRTYAFHVASPSLGDDEPSGTNNQCYALDVRISANYWPGGGDIEVSCQDATPGGACKGDSSGPLIPPVITWLGDCDCSTPAGQCITVDQSNLPPGCTVNWTINACSTNGQKHTTMVYINCPTPTPTLPFITDTPTPTPTSTPPPGVTVSPTVTPIPTPGSCVTRITGQTGVGGKNVSARVDGVLPGVQVSWFMDRSPVGTGGETATFNDVSQGTHWLYGAQGTMTCSPASFYVGTTATPIPGPTCTPNGASCGTNSQCCGGDCWGGGGNICRNVVVQPPSGGNCACGDGIGAPCCGGWWQEDGNGDYPGSGCTGAIPEWRDCIQGLICDAPGGSRCIKYKINGTVFVDDNENGVWDSGEQGYQGAQVDYWYGEPYDATCGKNDRPNFGNTCLGGTCSANNDCRSGWCTNNICKTASGSTTFSVDLIASSNGTGFYEFSPSKSYGTLPKAHVIRLKVPQGYQVSSPLTPEVQVREVSDGWNDEGPEPPVYFGIIPVNYIEGNVFVDNNFNRSKDAGETNYTTSAITITASEGTRSFSATSTTGAYKVRVRPGTYKVSYTNLPTGYQMINPRNGPPPSFSVTVGTGSCNAATGEPDAYCDPNNVVDLNFAMNNIYPWFQGVGGDMRIDKGFVDRIPPMVPAASKYVSLEGSGGTPGIVFTGDRVYDFGQGGAQASPNPYNWIVGGTTYPDRYTSVNSTSTRASTSFLTTSARLAGYAQGSMATACGGTLGNCTLNGATLVEGVYASSNPADTVVLVNDFTVPANANKDFLFLIQGDLRITKHINVRPGSTATFAVAGKIIIDKDLGELSNSTATTLEGFFVSDKSVIFEPKGTVIAPCNSDGSPLDKRVNIAGVVVANAAYTGGTFNNERNLCRDNGTYPTISMTERLDMVLNAPPFIQQQNYVWREVAP